MRVLLLGVAALMAACRPSPPTATIAHALAAPAPAIDPRIAVAENAVKDQLVDPDSARFEKIYTGRPGENFVCGWVNARNRMGGYNGFAGFYVTFKNGDVDDVNVDRTSDGPAGYFCSVLNGDVYRATQKRHSKSANLPPA